MGEKGEVEAEREVGEHAGPTGGEGSGRRAKSGPQLHIQGRKLQGWSAGGAGAKVVAIFHKKKLGKLQVWEH